MSAGAGLAGGTGVPRPVLTVSALRVSRAGREVLRGVSLEVARGELVAVMGLSGGGKTTLLRAIAGLTGFDSGEIDVDGFALSPGRLPRERRLAPLRRKVGLVFQQNALFEHLDARENVALAPVHAAGVPRAEALARADALLASLGVSHRAHALPREMSGGEAQRVAIARALAVDPPLLLMDEPTASLDPARRGELGESLSRLVSSGRSLLVSTHDDDFVRDHARRVVVLADGEVVEEGPAAAVLAAPSHPATRRLLSHEAAGGGEPPADW